jgi:phosphoribosyl-dephospho-CoA transferase
VAVNSREALRTHDLLLFRLAGYERAVPDWVDREGDSAWAVVRRQAATRTGMIASGLRGRERFERAAVEIRESDVVRVVSPEDLRFQTVDDLPASGVRESFEIIKANAREWFCAMAWGPTGSLGFQLATRWPVVRESSDLDIILRADAFITPEDARSILGRLGDLPCRVDCLLETPSGAVALAEWAMSSNTAVLLRTARGPVLAKDPWSADVGERAAS